MTPPVYSVRFLGIQGVVLVASYVVPLGHRAVLRDVDLYYGGSIGGATWYIHGAAGQSLGAGNFPPTVSGYQNWRGRAVYLGGETIQVVVTDTMDVTACGYLFTDP